MAQTTPSSSNWTPTQVYVLATICLVIGIGFGYFIRGSAPAAPSTSQGATSTSSQQPMSPGQLQPAPPQRSPEEVAQIVNPMLQQLKSDPMNSQLLTQIGNTYYDNGDFPKAIDYYGRALTISPKNNDVRTDMGTAFFYSGDPDKAIEQYNIVLKADPRHENALFNMGIVRWQGKKDPKGAIAIWEDLLKKRPDDPRRQQIEELIQRARSHPQIG